jgi:hypothetical protein
MESMGREKRALSQRVQGPNARPVVLVNSTVLVPRKTWMSRTASCGRSLGYSRAYGAGAGLEEQAVRSIAGTSRVQT